MSGARAATWYRTVPASCKEKLRDRKSYSSFGIIEAQWLFAVGRHLITLAFLSSMPGHNPGPRMMLPLTKVMRIEDYNTAVEQLPALIDISAPDSPAEPLIHRSNAPHPPDELHLPVAVVRRSQCDRGSLLDGVSGGR